MTAYFAPQYAASPGIASSPASDALAMTRATYAVVGDMHEVVPAVVEEIRKRR